MTEDVVTLGSDYPKQQARVREVLEAYEEIGPSGAFGAMLIKADLKEAEEAAMSGDLVRMIKAYQRLKEIDY